MKIFDRLTHLICLHYKKVLLVAFVMLLVSGFFASRIKIQVQFSDMLPAEIPQVAEFNRIITDFHSASAIFVGIEGEDEKELVQAAEELVPILAGLKNVRRVDYQVDTDFIRRHGFLLQEEEDLKNSIEIFSNIELLPLLRSINNNFEEEIIGDEERFATAEDELTAIQSLDGLVSFLSLEHNPEKVRQLLLGNEFFLSPDREMLILQVQPYISIDDYHEAMALAREVRGAVSNFARDFPDLSMGVTGIMVIGLEEQEGIFEGMAISTLLAMFLILALLIISFKMWTAPFIAMIPLICAIVYTAGLIGATVGHINMFTAFFAVLLLGLGIDFAIYLTSGFTEARTKGMTLEYSIKTMYVKVGRGIVAGAVTTAIVFFVLIFTGMQVLSEMGIILGTGILIALISTLFILPALFCLQYKIKPASLPSFSAGAAELMFLERAGSFIVHYRWLGGSLAIAITVAFFFFARQVGWQYDMIEMMPKGIPSVVMQERIIEKFETSPDVSMVTAKSVEEARRLKEAMEKKSLVGGVESISVFLPPYEEQKNIRLPLIEEFRKHLKGRDFNYVADENVISELRVELERLEHNVIEIGMLAYIGGQLRVAEKSDEIIESGALGETIELLSVSAVSNFQMAYIPVMRELLLEMTSGGVITLEGLPPEIKDRFVNEEGDRFLITIYPRGNVWDERILRTFDEQISSIEPRTSGTPTFFIILLDMIAERIRLATVLAFFAILIILTVDFKSIKLSLIAMVPIILGAVWMVGLMGVFGIKFNFTNIMAIPVILGIGIDYAIHIIHRYKVEGEIPIVLKTTGKAILLASLTTIIGFGSLGFSPHRGIAGMGHVLAIGVWCCFLTSVFVLPVILEWKKSRRREG
jgi:predicted RND superfamily exporter protein